MQPAKERPVYAANFANHRDATVCSNEQISNASIMHMMGEIDATKTAKPEIIKYYDKTKAGVIDTVKMLGEYAVKRRTLR